MPAKAEWPLHRETVFRSWENSFLQYPQILLLQYTSEPFKKQAFPRFLSHEFFFFRPTPFNGRSARFPALQKAPSLCRPPTAPSPATAPVFRRTLCKYSPAPPKCTALPFPAFCRRKCTKALLLLRFSIFPTSFSPFLSIRLFANICSQTAYHLLGDLSRKKRKIIPFCTILRHFSKAEGASLSQTGAPNDRNFLKFQKNTLQNLRKSVYCK